MAETQERNHAVRCEWAEGEPWEAQGTQLRRGSEVRGQYRKLKRGLQAKGMMPLLKNIVYLRHDKSIRNLISQVLRDLIPFCLIFVCRHMLSVIVVTLYCSTETFPHCIP